MLYHNITVTLYNIIKYNIILHSIAVVAPELFRLRNHLIQELGRLAAGHASSFNYATMVIVVVVVMIIIIIVIILVVVVVVISSSSSSSSGSSSSR